MYSSGSGRSSPGYNRRWGNAQDSGQSSMAGKDMGEQRIPLIGGGEYVVNCGERGEQQTEGHVQEEGFRNEEGGQQVKH